MLKKYWMFIVINVILSQFCIYRNRAHSKKSGALNNFILFLADLQPSELTKNTTVKDAVDKINHIGNI